MASNNLGKNKKGYGYTYTDIAGIHEYLESEGIKYYQFVEVIDGNDYVMTVPIVDGKELTARRGCRVTQATLQGVKNPAQEQGSALTYARRYSLLMAFGLATTDDDAAMCAVSQTPPKAEKPKVVEKVNPLDTRTEAQKETAIKIKKNMLATMCSNATGKIFTSEDIEKRIAKEGIAEKDVECWLDETMGKMSNGSDS